MKQYLLLFVVLCGLGTTPLPAEALHCGTISDWYDGPSPDPYWQEEPPAGCPWSPFGNSAIAPFSTTTYELDSSLLRQDDVVSAGTHTLKINIEPESADVFTNFFYQRGTDYLGLFGGNRTKEIELPLTMSGTYWLLTYSSKEPQPGPEFAPDDQMVLSFEVEGEAEIATSTATSTPIGASSVLFLPGIQASRLYTDESGSENRLWEPNRNADVEKLAMTEAGESVNDIYTRDVVDEIYGVPRLGENIYKSFLERLAQLMDENVIAMYEPFAYDWRYSVFDVATKDVKYPDGEQKQLLAEVLKLSETSHTGKVTIVAHSNGGLVAKALLAIYGDNELAGKVDKLIMVGTPQLGTPKAVGALLHGYDQELGLGFITGAGVAREAMENMPGAYTLLPSDKYFDITNKTVVSADGGEKLQFVKEYGDIDTSGELYDFLLDTKHLRSDDVDIDGNPTILNESLLMKAMGEQGVLDDWHAPTGVEVYEIVGNGVSTVESFEYREFSCGLNPFCSSTSYVEAVPIITNQGDGTVVVDSAGGYDGDKTTAYVDLGDENRGLFRWDHKHANFTESESVQDFIISALKYHYLSEELVVPEYTAVDTEYTVIGGHSPVTLLATNKDGEQVGVSGEEILEDIPGAQYLVFGGGKYLILPDDGEEYIVSVSGTDSGYYSLTVDHVDSAGNNENLATLTGLTVSTSTRASFAVEGGVAGELTVDNNNDGVVDELVGWDGVHEPVIIQSGSASGIKAQPSLPTASTDQLVISTVSGDLTDEQKLEQMVGLLQQVVKLLNQLNDLKKYE